MSVENDPERKSPRHETGSLLRRLLLRWGARMAGHSGHSIIRIYVHRQLPGEPEIKSPNGFHALPSNLTNCICFTAW